MTNSILDKIKPVIDFSLVSKFDANELQSKSYIPVCLAKGYIYVLAKQAASQNDIYANVSEILRTDKINIKHVGDSDFSVLLNYVMNNMPKSTDVDEHKIKDDAEIKLKYDDTVDEDEAGASLSSDTSNLHPDHHDDRFFAKKIGEVLVAMGLVTKEQIFNALVESKKNHIPLGTILVQQGIITLDELKKALTAQQGYETV